MSTRAAAAVLDAADPLARLRDAFALPDGVLYLDGNSLGALPHVAIARVGDTVAREWGEGLIRSWTAADWIGAPARVGAKIASLIGAAPDEVIVADSTSVNLFKLLVAALRAQPGRSVILAEAGNFPTDLYIAQGVADLLPGVSVRTAARDAIAQAIDRDTAVLLLTHVHYKTAAAFDMAALTAAAQAHGALTIWDLSHSAGAVPVDLGRANADLAVGCGYKYLNGGPGAPAFLYVAARHQARLHSPLTGWMGHRAGFDFSDDYAPAPGIARFLCGTPPVLGIAALEAGVDLMLATDRAALFAKGQALVDLFIAAVEAQGDRLGLTLATPRDRTRRGSHVAFRHAQADAIMQALIARGVIGDYRAPDILRFGFTPLTLRYVDAWDAAAIVGETIASGVWRDPAFQAKRRVT